MTAAKAEIGQYLHVFGRNLVFIVDVRQWIASDQSEHLPFFIGIPISLLIDDFRQCAVGIRPPWLNLLGGGREHDEQS